MNVGATVPEPVWVQIGVVVVFCLLLLGAIMQVKNLLKDQREGQLAVQKELLTTQQTFIDAQNKSWQEFLSAQTATDCQQRGEDRTRLTEMATAITKMGEAIDQLNKAMTAAFNQLNTTVTDHIKIDDARFSVILGERKDGGRRGYDKKPETSSRSPKKVAQ